MKQVAPHLTGSAKAGPAPSRLPPPASPSRRAGTSRGAHLAGGPAFLLSPRAGQVREREGDGTAGRALAAPFPAGAAPRSPADEAGLRVTLAAGMRGPARPERTLPPEGLSRPLSARRWPFWESGAPRKKGRGDPRNKPPSPGDVKASPRPGKVARRSWAAPTKSETQGESAERAGRKKLEVGEPGVSPAFRNLLLYPSL